ncbi:hypothetical protein AB0N05_05080 [Nocardia sp. NPDC051030]|uniref:hypothetical protein n=1 Tax=Nocardia sp. NPDC051030 TaxID=3155162 RepID=UPI0034233941
MPWDTWALLSILALCSSVILWSCWGFYRDSHPAHTETLRLPLTGGGHVDLPCPSTYPVGRHRARHRIHQTPQPTRHPAHAPLERAA